MAEGPDCKHHLDTGDARRELSAKRAASTGSTKPW
jgi:hypothetical protein